MFNKLLNHRSIFQIIFLKRSATVRSDFDLGNQMKLLDDKKQFNKALQLFDQYKENNTAIYSSFPISQALKACAQIGDLQRGSTIHHLISSHTKKDSHILASLIHLYSKFQQNLFFLILL